MEIFFLVLLTFIATAVGTITTFGSATIMVPALSLFYSFNPVLLFTGVIHAIGNIGKILFFQSGIKWKLLLLFGGPGIIFSYLGSLLIPSIPSFIILRALGVFIILYVLLVLSRPKWQLPKSDGIALIAGSLSGMSAAVFGVQGVIRTIFLSSLDLKKDVFLFTAGALGIVIDFSRLLGYLKNGFTLNNTLLIGLIISIPFSFLGSFTGKKLVDKIPQKKFKYLIAAALILISIRYIIWA